MRFPGRNLAENRSGSTETGPRSLEISSGGPLGRLRLDVAQKSSPGHERSGGRALHDVCKTAAASPFPRKISPAEQFLPAVLPGVPTTDPGGLYRAVGPHIPHQRPKSKTHGKNTVAGGLSKDPGVLLKDPGVL